MTNTNRLRRGRTLSVFLIALVSGPFAIACLPTLTSAIPGEEDVSPEATPQVQQIKPNQAAAGEELTVEIEGGNFSRGAYVSFSSPAVRVVSTERVSATRLETKLAVAKKAQAGTVSLFVSNPAGSVAEVPFTISAEAGAPSARPPAPAAPNSNTQPPQTGVPEVAAADPPRATRGGEVKLKVTGKNFAPGAKISFSNPGIRVLETKAASSTELVAKIQVAADAPTGTTSLFVVNPDDSEVEMSFEVLEANAASTVTSAAASSVQKNAGSNVQHFEVFNLGEGINILQNPDKPKGTLTLVDSKLKYEEGGKEIFAAGPGDVKEIEINSILGVNTGTFHILLSSGKTFNFVAASLRLADTQGIVGSLRQALH